MYMEQSILHFGFCTRPHSPALVQKNGWEMYLFLGDSSNLKF